MAETCTHVETTTDAAPDPRTPDACEECRDAGRSDWVNLRLCVECGHVGCCDDSPERHASGHFRSSSHPLVRSYEPGEDWWYCYVDDFAFEVPGAPPAPSHA